MPINLWSNNKYPSFNTACKVSAVLKKEFADMSARHLMGMCRRKIDRLNLPIGTLSLAASHTPEGKNPAWILDAICRLKISGMQPAQRPGQTGCITLVWICKRGNNSHGISQVSRWILDRKPRVISLCAARTAAVAADLPPTPSALAHARPYISYPYLYETWIEHPVALINSAVKRPLCVLTVCVVREYHIGASPFVQIRNRHL